MLAPKVQLLLTGNELMSGDIVDSNSAMIAQQLKDIGLELKRKVTVSDDLPLLVDEIQHISQQCDILIINGGLGPTIDDMTAEALAKAAKVTLTKHTDALEHLTAWCHYRKAELNQQNLKQTILPAGCNIVANRIGSAVGFSLTLNNCLVICTPGVPPELKIMMNEQIIPSLLDKVPNNIKTHVTRLQVFGIGESSIQKLIDEKMPDWPAEIELGFRASLPLMEVKLTTREASAKQLKKIWINKLKDLLGDHLFNIVQNKPITLSEYVVKMLQEKSLKITTAESCTGGLIASELTKVAGASAVFEAGFVTYSNKIKEKLINVSSTTLQEAGAVSEACVIEMANGALTQASADIAIAVSGIAGPDGGSADKPVGTVWIAWGSKNNLHSVGLQISGNRQYFQKSVATICIDLIRRYLINSIETPRYIADRKQ